MSSQTQSRLTSSQRLGRGLKYTAVGPVDLTRGALGVSAHSVASGASWVGNRYRRGRAARQLREDLAAAGDTIAQEFAAAQQVVSNLPTALQEARGSRRSRRPLLLVTAAALALAAGAAAFSVIRRSTRPAEPSVRPPSVEVAPRP
jgi:hypothetical protein